MTRTTIAAGMFVLVGLVGGANAQIADGGFEAGPFGGAWIESSTNFGTPVCDVLSCGFGGGSGPANGTYWAWFGGIAAFEAGSVSQLVTIPAGFNELRFDFELPVASGDSRDYLELRVDGTTLWSATGADAPFLGYAGVSVDVSAFADGGSHTVLFTSQIFGANGEISNFFVDNVALTPAPGVAALLGFGGIAATRRRR